MDDKRSKGFTAHQGKFLSQWQDVVPCEKLGLNFDDQQVRISTGLRLGAINCVAYTWFHCGKKVERDGLHCVTCTKSAGCFSRNSTINSLIKQISGSFDLPSMVEPRGLQHRTRRTE